MSKKKSNGTARSYSAATPSFTDRVGSTKAGRAAMKSGYLTVETVTMWAVFALTLICNAAFELGQLGGVTSASVAYDVYTWFTPAGYVFAIWTLIYLGLVAWLVHYTREVPLRRSEGGGDGFTTASALFVASCGLNVIWLALWHFQAIGLSLIAIVALWFVLGAMYLHVRRSERSALGWAPISLYASWVTVATISNFAIAITRALGGGVIILNELSAILLSAGVLALGAVLRRRFDDIVIPLVFLWAIVGVGVHIALVNPLVSAVIFILSIIGAVAAFAGYVSFSSMRGHVRS